MGVIVGRIDYEDVLVSSRAEWRGWLEANHARSPGIWLVTYKKGSGKPHLPYDDIVEEALCFGWIDSRPNKLDAERSKLLLTPRKPGSPWSALNKRRVEKLVAEGLMTPAGLAKIEAAKRDGSWAALDAAEALEEPPELGAALAADPDARRGFDAFRDSVKKPLLYWVTSAKRPETRARRIEQIVAGAKAGRSPLDWRAQRDAR